MGLHCLIMVYLKPISVSKLGQAASLSFIPKTKGGCDLSGQFQEPMTKDTEDLG